MAGPVSEGPGASEWGGWGCQGAGGEGRVWDLLWTGSQQIYRGIRCGVGERGTKDHTKPGWSGWVDVAPFSGLGEGDGKQAGDKRVKGLSLLLPC